MNYVRPYFSPLPKNSLTCRNTQAGAILTSVVITILPTVSDIKTIVLHQIFYLVVCNFQSGRMEPQVQSAGLIYNF